MLYQKWYRLISKADIIYSKDSLQYKNIINYIDFKKG